ncbi:Leo1-like protein-domain-containing protein [Xylogone sp. PMI_703]|nr:Leo1-like protein-domain-containing protein [Xylogone sp. PMI_703]
MASDSEDDVMNSASEVEDDLFGDDDDAGEQTKTRELSDQELDSGDDEGRYDRVADRNGDQDEGSLREARIMESTLWRHPLPKPSDGEFNVLRLPKFLGIDPRPFEPETFEPPAYDHHSNTKSANFSARATAASTMRYRKNPTTGELESNTVIYRWSDGSTTLAVGDQHFELQTKPLAPAKDNKTYQEVQDSHVYFASPSITSQLVVTVGHMTNQFTVRPNKDIEDDALEKLQRSLAAAARGGLKGEDKSGPELISNTVDPELQKKRAELAEKERLRAQRRRETAAEKASIPFGRSRGLGGGLTVDDLEGRAGKRIPGARSRPKPGGKRPRRRPEYDSDDDLPRGRTREDEYDKEDDFLASSDEELEEGDDDDEEEEDILDDESEEERPKAKKHKSSRRDEGSDADADADLDDEDAPAAPAAEATSGGRARKRNIIEDDDDDE